MPKTLGKIRPHFTQNEQLLFELSRPGKTGYQLPELDVPNVDAAEALGACNVREAIEDLSLIHILFCAR